MYKEKIWTPPPSRLNSGCPLHLGQILDAPSISTEFWTPLHLGRTLDTPSISAEFWMPPQSRPNFGHPLHLGQILDAPSISAEFSPFPCGFLEIFCRIVGCPPRGREFLSTPEMEKNKMLTSKGFKAANMLL